MILKKTLKSVTIENNIVTLTKQLIREDYLKYKKFMELIKGKYSSSTKNFHFGYDPSAPINNFLNTGVMPDKNPTAFFPTPRIAIDAMFDMIDSYIEHDPYNRKMRVLEPSAGGGAIADALRDRYPHIQLDTVEFLKENQDVLKKKGYNPFCGSFLDYTEGNYDFIIMNPPFSVKGDNRAFMTHVLHAFDLLSSRGEIIAIVPTGFIKNSTKRDKEFRDFLGKYCGGLFHLEAGTFKDSGTNVETLILKINKSEWKQKTHQRYKNFHQYLFSVMIDDKVYEMLEDKSKSIKQIVKYHIESLRTIGDSRTIELLTFLPLEYQELYEEHLQYLRDEIYPPKPKRKPTEKIGGLFDL